MSLLIHDMTAERRGQLALADERVRLSWADLDLVANRAVNGLLALPFDRDRRVAIFAPNAAESVIAYLAGLLGGISTVPASFHLTAAELAYILQDSRRARCSAAPRHSTRRSRPRARRASRPSSPGDRRRATA